jgi:hypothetical protein
MFLLINVLIIYFLYIVYINYKNYKISKLLIFYNINMKISRINNNFCWIFKLNNVLFQWKYTKEKQINYVIKKNHLY